MRKLLLSTVAILSLAAAAPATAQQSGSMNQPAASQPGNQPSAARQADQPGASQQAMQERNLSKEQIRQVQEALDQKGFKSGQPDGVLGRETKNAIKEFQQKQGWKTTGELDSQTLSALGVSDAGQAGTPSTTGSQPPSSTGGAR